MGRKHGNRYFKKEYHMLTRTTVVWIGITLVLILILSACSQPAMTPAPAAEEAAEAPAERPVPYEPNDICLQAPAVEPGQEITAALETAEDVDFYQIPLTPAAHTTITLTVEHPAIAEFAFFAYPECQMNPVEPASGSGEADYFGEQPGFGPVMDERSADRAVATFALEPGPAVVYLKITGTEDFQSQEVYRFRVGIRYAEEPQGTAPQQ